METCPIAAISIDLQCKIRTHKSVKQVQYRWPAADISTLAENNGFIEAKKNATTTNHFKTDGDLFLEFTFRISVMSNLCKCIALNQTIWIIQLDKSPFKAIHMMRMLELQ